jgi:aspartate racemase
MANTPQLSEARRALLEKYLRGENPRTTSAGTIPRRSPGEHVPLSFGQQQLWLLAHLIPDSPVYNESVTVRLPGVLDVTALELSFNELIQRQEAWRTSFSLVDDQPVQVIHPFLTYKLPIVDLQYLPEAERESEALRIATAEVLRPFNLAQVPLLRATLFRLNDADHRLFIALHHIIFDGFTVYRVFLPELRALYEACTSGQPSMLSPLPIQYADYAAWQRNWLQGEKVTSQLSYWKRQLTGAPTTLELPTDHPHPANPTYRGSIQSFTLSRHFTAKLKALSQQEGCFLYVTLLAAFSILLYRYTSQEDMLIGTATAGRNQPELQALVGIFINTLVMRADLSGNPSIGELLIRLREMTIDAQAHQDVPFEYVVKELQPERGAGQNPLFQVLLMLEPPIPVLPSGWTLTHMDVNTHTSKFDLSLILEDREEGLLGRFEYNTDLFDDGTIARMVGHWQMLLNAIIQDPTQHISDLPLLTENECKQLLEDWNATRTTYPVEKCVHQLFEEQAQRRPEAIALIYENQVMTYRELNERANQLAHRLLRLGVVTEQCVGLYMDRSLEMIVGLLGILKAGGAYVPLDPSYPLERLAFMLQDTRAAVLLTQPALLEMLPTLGLEVICLDGSWKAIDQEPLENPLDETRAENLAYVMYTSGSTGRPKGVEIQHSSINRLVFGIDYARLDETRTILHMAPISFDASTFEVWGSLLHGARCVLYPERIPTPKNIGMLIRKHHVTTLWLTASLFNAVIDDAPVELLGVDQLLNGGEALSVTHIRRALRLLPGTELINGYGPTESTTFTCCYSIPGESSQNLLSIPIGRPIGNTQVYILDKNLQPVPIGIPGELYIGGAGLARGYLNQPELTQEKFISHPFRDQPGARLYKTGDLVRYLPDGMIEFLGRIDQQVKIRGYRVEPGEIEVVLGQHRAVREALVLVHQNKREEKSLVAYVVPVEECGVTKEDLRNFLKERLPEYMIPLYFILLNALPLTANGKLDRKGLPAPESNWHASGASYVAAKLIIHHQLVNIWEELLNIRPIGIRDNFFYLGGHSLLAARLVYRIEQAFGKKVSLSTLFARPTIELLAQFLQQQTKASSRAAIVMIQPGQASNKPFFYLHGDYMGGAFYCFTLARDLGEEQPFYVLEPYNFTGLPVPPAFEEIAAAHLQALRSFQPEGPYMLGGFCNGGLMAYEMACQLYAAGETVDLLVLVDPASPPHQTLRSLLSRFCTIFRIGEDRQLNWFLRLRHIYKYLRFPDYRNGLQDSEGIAKIDTQMFEPEQDHYHSFLQKIRAFLPIVNTLRQEWPGTYRWVASGYTPRVYPGKITFVWSSEELFRKTWKRKMPGVKEEEVYVIPGTHLINTAEQLDALSERLYKCLAKPSAGSQASTLKKE